MNLAIEVRTGSRRNSLSIRMVSAHTSDSRAREVARESEQVQAVQDGVTVVNRLDPKPIREVEGLVPRSEGCCILQYPFSLLDRTHIQMTVQIISSSDSTERLRIL